MGVANDVKRAKQRVPLTTQPVTAAGQPAGFEVRKSGQLLNKEWNVAAAEAMKKSFIGFIERLFTVCIEEYNKNMDEQRAKLKPLFEVQTKIQVKKIYTEALHDSEQYEIVLVDENATQSPGKSGSTKPTSLD